MKKLFTLILALVAVLSAGAAEQSTVVVSESWTCQDKWEGGNTQVYNSSLPNLTAGDKIQVEVTSVSTTDQWPAVYIQYTTGDEWTWTDFDKTTEPYQVMLTAGTPTTAEFTLTESQVTKILSGHSLIIKGSGYTADKVTYVHYTDDGITEIDLTQEMNSHWNASYDTATKTITWTNEEGQTYSWGGCGWWYGDTEATAKDYSGYTKIVYEFDGTAPTAGGIDLQYVSGDPGYCGFNAGDTKAECIIDATKGEHVKAIYLKLAEAGSITLKKVYLVRAYTEDRTTATGSYGTICLPYAATATGAVVMSCSGLSQDGKGIVFNYVGETEETSTALKAGVPYLYRATADAQSFRYDKSAEAADATAVNNFTGVYAETDISQTDATATITNLFLNTEDNKFHPAGNYVHVGANKCYFTALPAVTAAKAGVSFGIFDGAATAINNVNANTSTSSAQANGKFINNGKLVIVKDGKKFNAAGAQVK